MERVARLGRQARWYVSSLMGDNHYQRYLTHRRRDRPGEPVLSEAQYWRVRHRQTETNPGARCC
jgi:uncharacterized short protein YbdD (DUF466 family)